jgi:hypothetical protein
MSYYYQDDLDLDDPSLPPMPTIIRTTPLVSVVEAVFRDLGEDGMTDMGRAVMAEFHWQEAVTAKRQARMLLNAAVLATAPDSPEAKVILDARAYSKAAKLRAKARGYKPIRRR